MATTENNPTYKLFPTLAIYGNDSSVNLTPNPNIQQSTKDTSSGVDIDALKETYTAIADRLIPNDLKVLKKQLKANMRLKKPNPNLEPENQDEHTLMAKAPKKQFKNSIKLFNLGNYSFSIPLRATFIKQSTREMLPANLKVLHSKIPMNFMAGISFDAKFD